MAGESFMNLCIKAFDFLAPHVKEYQRRKHLNFSEGRRHLDARNYTEAEKHLNQALTDRATNSPKRRVEVLVALAETQIRLRKFDTAETTARSAVDVAVNSRDASLQATALESFAGVQLQNKLYADAEQTIAQIQALEERKAKPDYVLLARCSRMLAAALQHAGRPAEALEASRKAADLAERGAGPDHVDTAHALAELGALYTQQGNSREAQQCIRRALEIHREELGADSPEATKDLYLLAASLEEAGDLQGAMAEYEKVLALRSRQVGGSRQEDAETQVRLAILYLQAERFPAARELLVPAVAVLERKGGESLPLALSALAYVEEQSGRDAVAESLRLKAAKYTPKASTPA
jgi:tetratricopeptide (TPR) repeat protein